MPNTSKNTNVFSITTQVLKRGIEKISPVGFAIEIKFSDSQIKELFCKNVSFRKIHQRVGEKKISRLLKVDDYLIELSNQPDEIIFVSLPISEENVIGIVFYDERENFLTDYHFQK